MPKLRVEDLTRIAEESRRSTSLREGRGRAKITVHMGTCGIAAGARKIMNAVLAEIESRNVEDVLVTTSGCAGLCSREPMATVELPDQPPVKYADLTPDKMRRIFEEHVMGGEVAQDLALVAGHERTL
jgi:NADP-reducing hydrogenase subunit HndB